MCSATQCLCYHLHSKVHKPQITNHRHAEDKGLHGLPPRVRVMRRIILCRAMPLSTTELGLSSDMASYMSLSISQKAMVLSPTKACKPEGLGFTDFSDVHVLVHQPEGNGLVTHQSLQARGFGVYRC